MSGLVPSIDAAAVGDFVLPFQLDSLAVRGRFIRLDDGLDAALRAHDYPASVAAQLGEAMVLASTLASSIKYDGIFTLQVRGNGPIRLVVSDIATDGTVRGYAQFNDRQLRRALAQAPTENGAVLPENPVPHLLGAGSLAFTVDQGPDTERYQAVVALEGATLAECAHHYFRQSEQLKTGIKIAVERDHDGRWIGGGLLLQKLPDDLTPDGYDRGAEDEEEDRWRRAVVLMATASADELVDRGLPATRLLFRLFHEDGVRVFEPRALRRGCRCSRQRIGRVLRSFAASELADLKTERGDFDVACEFCCARYTFTDADLGGAADRAAARF